MMKYDIRVDVVMSNGIDEHITVVTDYSKEFLEEQLSIVVDRFVEHIESEGIADLCNDYFVNDCVIVVDGLKEDFDEEAKDVVIRFYVNEIDE